MRSTTSTSRRRRAAAEGGWPLTAIPAVGGSVASIDGRPMGDVEDVHRSGGLFGCDTRCDTCRGVRRGIRQAGRRGLCQLDADGPPAQRHRIRSPPPRPVPGAVPRSLAVLQVGIGCCTAAPAESSRSGCASARQVGANYLQVDAIVALTEGSQALGDSLGRLAVAENFDGHLQAFKIIDRHQYRFRLAVAGERDPFVVLAHPTGQRRQLRLRCG